MALTQLTLTDFRNHRSAAICPVAGFNILYGPNGAGKTNILEAISLLVPGRGLRRSALSDMICAQGAGGFTVSAAIGDVSLGTGVEAASPERRKVRINGATASINALAEWHAVMWLTPAMDRLFADGAGARRRFLDRLVLALEPAHAANSSRYDQALRQRNRLLSDNARPDPVWLDGLEAAMAQYGAAITISRNRVIADLSDQLALTPSEPFAVPRIALVDVGLEDAAALAGGWRVARSRDASAGRTLNGPHRADLAVHHAHNGQSADLCSTGEQKALLLSLILAHAALVAQQRGQAPVLLLDEVAAHLDPNRRAAFFERLAATGSQAWMTGTEAALFDAVDRDAKMIYIQGDGTSSY